MKNQLVVIQPTPFCNINCRYCYLPQRTLSRRMSNATLAQIFQVLCASPFLKDELTCIWHAGEPLVLSIDFYRQAFLLQQQYNVNGLHISNAFQTNATLITQQWCDFIREHDIHVGVSIDGPQYLHDAQRVDRKNRGTFERVLKGIALLRANDIPYSAIAVVTGETVHYPDEFWHFFAELQPSRLGLNPEEVEGCNRHSSLHTLAGIEQYKRFLQRLLSLNEQSQSPLPIREFDTLLAKIQAGQVANNAGTNTPMSILNFDYEGNISTFSPELLSFTHPVYGRFTFGNVFTTQLEDILQDGKFVPMYAAIQRGIASCRESCDYFALCGGGAPSNKLHENGSFDSTETHACRLRIKITTDVLLEHLEQRYKVATA
ncbi:cyclophane-forming radical SAM/SPASM peptide maturase GrrM/OscB [Dictyobacter arantiisoli]|uniref:cyclophane-forming radical SAM/SPASM peptide maturase GrrM/OscB n=1 Tax=Dictyobacter arantiisoli TaxID=2014874 RepID=UPI00155AF1C9|nr:cyclophane-forming radical SAM/SPASM peptide maturase GrrM/OscB [Dictyobacter arantiisoli]